jgi:hypothetical protein
VLDDTLLRELDTDELEDATLLVELRTEEVLDDTLLEELDTDEVEDATLLRDLVLDELLVEFCADEDDCPWAIPAKLMTTATDRKGER